MRNITIIFVAVLVLLSGCDRLRRVKSIGTYPQEAHGYDLSHHNKNIKWGRLQEANAQFVYLKATEGVSFADPCFKEYRRQARRHGMKVGAYHFMRPKVSGRRQFEYFKKVVGNDMDLIPVLDVEVKGISNDNIRQFVEACERHYGVKPMIYSSFLMHATHRSAIKDCKWWMAHYHSTARTDYDLWQFSDKKRVHGMQIDHNYINPRLTLEDFLIRNK
ncbi:MAG: glycoside hydrolase family 25 protein [Muribaculaceae bacterium]|nr:glycoside hydrolase family 25 protein [Muribaculaceae bacterium]